MGVTLGDVTTLDGPFPDYLSGRNPLAEFARFCEDLGVESGEEAAAALALWRYLYRHTTWLGPLDGDLPVREPGCR